jgi:hypothetical protein
MARHLRTAIIRAAVLLAAVLLAACDGFSSGPDEADGSLTGSFYGTVEGTEKGNPFMRIVNLHLTESMGNVTGSFSIVGGRGAGTISGSVTGSTVSFTFDQTAPCEGFFIGTASLVGGRLTGLYAGSSCRGTVTANFDVNRQAEAIEL